MSKKITITAQQQGEFLAKIADQLKYFESTIGYIMADEQGKLYLIEGGREYHKAITKGLKEIEEIFDVYDRIYGFQGAVS